MKKEDIVTEEGNLKEFWGDLDSPEDKKWADKNWEKLTKKYKKRKNYR